jgi:hypothetical protein
MLETEIANLSLMSQFRALNGFAGMVVTLVPKFRTRPLTIRYQARDSSGLTTG